MKFLRLLPNSLTLANLTCGAIASYHIAHSYDTTPAVYLLFLAAFFDLLDGAAARKLGVNGDMGRELDSLADVISFGLAPSIIIFSMLERTLSPELQPLKYAAFANVLGAAYRLARFNVAESTVKTFNGMPSPANGIFWASLFAIVVESNQAAPTPAEHWIWPTNMVITFLVITTLLMVSQVEMFSFKLKPGGIAKNKSQFIFGLLGLILSIAVYAVFEQWLFIVPLLILLYIILSVTTFIWKNNE
ncbi:MAG: CDP-alcohol phosphatidyltransferase family protein [Flavobacteriales bacterium]|jgi:CDP-diacylglycerol--serine O-phosphatidyltransferase